MELRIASWNLHGTESSWSFLEQLVDRHGIQVFLLQEARKPPAVPADWRIHPAPEKPDDWRLSVPDGLERNFCSAVVVTDSALTMTPYGTVPLHAESYGKLAASHPGQFAAAEIGLGGGMGQATVISLYGIWDRMGDSDDIYADATLHRALSDLSFLFGRRKHPKVVVAGDLNIWHKYDQSTTLRNWSSSWAQRFDSVFARLDAFGLDLIGPFRAETAPPLERCPCGSEECRHVNTYRHQREPTATPYQNDYMFTTDNLLASLRSCSVIDDADVWEHSDHVPVVAAFDV